MSDDNKILSMPGVIAEQPATTQPVPEVVQALEDLLAKARTGYIRAVSFGYVRSNERISYGWFGVKQNLVRLHLLHSAMVVAVTDMGAEIADTSTDVDPENAEKD